MRFIDYFRSRKTKIIIPNPDLRPEKEDGNHSGLLSRVSTRLGLYQNNVVLPFIESRIQKEVARIREQAISENRTISEEERENIAQLRRDLEELRKKLEHGQEEIKSALSVQGMLEKLGVYRELETRLEELRTINPDYAKLTFDDWVERPLEAILGMVENQGKSARKYKTNILYSVLGGAVVIAGICGLTYYKMGQLNPIKAIKQLRTTTQQQAQEINKSNQRILVLEEQNTQYQKRLSELEAGTRQLTVDQGKQERRISDLKQKYSGLEENLEKTTTTANAAASSYWDLSYEFSQDKQSTFIDSLIRESEIQAQFNSLTRRLETGEKERAEIQKKLDTTAKELSGYKAQTDIRLSEFGISYPEKLSLDITRRLPETQGTSSSHIDLESLRFDTEELRDYNIIKPNN